MFYCCPLTAIKKMLSCIHSSTMPVIIVYFMNYSFLIQSSNELLLSFWCLTSVNGTSINAATSTFVLTGVKCNTGLLQVWVQQMWALTPTHSVQRASENKSTWKEKHFWPALLWLLVQADKSCVMLHYPIRQDSMNNLVIWTHHYLKYRTYTSTISLWKISTKK